MLHKQCCASRLLQLSFAWRQLLSVLHLAKSIVITQEIAVALLSTRKSKSFLQGWCWSHKSV